MARISIARSALALVAVLGSGCAPEFDKISEIETLRVMAVQKDSPYVNFEPPDQSPAPKSVTLSMLWRDGKDREPTDPPRPVQVWWMSGCQNPLGDLFYSCFAPGSGFPDRVETEQCPPEGPPPAPGDPVPPNYCDNKYTVELSPEIMNRPPSTDPTQPVYGLSYVFFALCAGTLEVSPGSAERDFPIACRDAAGNRLGPDDFVAGYTSVYAYNTKLEGQDITNANPPLSGFVFGGEPVENRCVGDECLSIPESWSNLRCLGTPEPEPPDGSIAVPCVKACEDDGDEACPETAFRPELVLPAGGLAAYPEPDQLSNATRDRDITEQMWINYYAERGGVKSEVRLLNDAFAGVNDDFGTEFWAPKEPGPTVLWAVVHDNRGGQSWVGMPLLIEPAAAP